MVKAVQSWMAKHSGILNISYFNYKTVLIIVSFTLLLRHFCLSFSVKYPRVVQDLWIHIYYTAGVVLTFSNNNESISLPPQIPLGSDVTPERIKLRRNTENQDGMLSNKIAGVSLNSGGAESESVQDQGIVRNPNLSLELSLASKIVEVKQGGLNSWKVPNEKGDLRFDHCQFLCKNTSAGLVSMPGMDLSCDTQMSLLDQSLESEVRLQSLPLQTVNFVNPDESVQETKQREMQKRDKIKQHFKTKRNEIAGRGQEKGKYKHQVGLALSNVNQQGKVSGDYSLPRPSTTFGRETETGNTTEKHKTVTPSQQSKLSNASITGKNRKIDVNSANMNFQTTASKIPPNFDVKTKEQIALGPEGDTHNLGESLINSMTASRPPQRLATSRNTSNGETINENHAKYESHRDLQKNCVDFSTTTPKANKKHETSSDKIDKNNNNDPCALSKYQYKEPMAQSNLLKPENERQGEALSHRGENGRKKITTVKTRKPKEDLRQECCGIGDSGLSCSSIEDKNIFKDDTLYHNEKSGGGIGKTSKREKKVKEVLPKVRSIVEDNESESAEENLEKLRQINKTLKESKLCKVCRDKDANRLFLPCAHLACCSLCSPAVRNCPQCKGNIRGIVSVYFG